jgi:hypothetical protein
LLAPRRGAFPFDGRPAAGSLLALRRRLAAI